MLRWAPTSIAHGTCARLGQLGVLLLPLALSRAFTQFATSGLENALSYLLFGLFAWHAVRPGRSISWLAVGLGAVAPNFAALTERYIRSHLGGDGQSRRFISLVGDAEEPRA